MGQNNRGRPSSNKGQKMSDSSRAKMSAAKKGKTCGENNNMYGKRHKPESIQKMKDNRKPKIIRDEPYVYLIRDPQGVEYQTSNLFYFGQNHNLDSRELRRISRPENHHRYHRGWQARRL
jgi:hypothetical protein